MFTANANVMSAPAKCLGSGPSDLGLVVQRKLVELIFPKSARPTIGDGCSRLSKVGPPICRAADHRAPGVNTVKISRAPTRLSEGGDLFVHCSHW